MATPVEGNGALDAVGVEVDNTLQLRYLRVRFHNANTTTDRVVTVKVGGASFAAARQIDRFVLKPSAAAATVEGNTREFGPVALASGTRLWAAQDAGTDVNYAKTGEY